MILMAQKFKFRIFRISIRKFPIPSNEMKIISFIFHRALDMAMVCPKYYYCTFKPIGPNSTTDVPPETTTIVPPETTTTVPPETTTYVPPETTTFVPQPGNGNGLSWTSKIIIICVAAFILLIILIFAIFFIMKCLTSPQISTQQNNENNPSQSNNQFALIMNQPTQNSNPTFHTPQLAQLPRTPSPLSYQAPTNSENSTPTSNNSSNPSSDPSLITPFEPPFSKDLDIEKN